MRRLLFLSAVLVFAVGAAPARAQTPTPAVSQTITASPSASPTLSPEANAGNAVFGLLFLTFMAMAGYYVAKWLRRRTRPRPPGPWFGGREGRMR